MCGGGEDQILVAVFIVSMMERLLALHRNSGCTAVIETNQRGHEEDVLVETGEEEDAVLAERTAQRKAALVLSVCGFEIEPCGLSVQRVIAQEIEPAAMGVVTA